nr:hypothetical protein [Pseudomonas sp. Marseille-Q3773]
MTRFNQLLEAYDSAHSDREAYWDRVRQAIHVFAEEFREYLGIEADQRIALRGKGSIKVLSIGGFNSQNGFEQQAFDEMPRNGDSVHFAVRIAFGNDPAGETPVQAVYALAIKQGDQPDVFEVSLISDFEVFETKGPSFQALCEYLWQNTLQRLITR